jgi:hypothetical protein
MSRQTSKPTETAEEALRLVATLALGGAFDRSAPRRESPKLDYAVARESAAVGIASSE